MQLCFRHVDELSTKGVFAESAETKSYLINLDHHSKDKHTKKYTSTSSPYLEVMHNLRSGFWKALKTF